MYDMRYRLLVVSVQPLFSTCSYTQLSVLKYLLSDETRCCNVFAVRLPGARENSRRFFDFEMAEAGVRNPVLHVGHSERQSQFWHHITLPGPLALESSTAAGDT